MVTGAAPEIRTMSPAFQTPKPDNGPFALPWSPGLRGRGPQFAGVFQGSSNVLQCIVRTAYGLH